MKYRGFVITLAHADWAQVYEPGEEPVKVRKAPNDSLINSAKAYIDYLYDSNVEVTDDA